MELNLDIARLSMFIGGILLFLLLETVFSARAWTGHRGRRLVFHAGVAALNSMLVRAFVYVPFLFWTVHVEQEGWGISRWLGLVGWVEIVASFVVLDAFDYFWHRANHRFHFLWRFHKAHHADVEMDVTTSLRFHPGELLISGLVKALWILVWGPTVVAWFLFEAMVSLSAQFHHSNIDFPDKVERWLSLFVVTPRYHAAHHAVDRHWGDANFSTILSVWDRIFRSYSQPEDGGATTNAPGSIGLPEGRELAFSPLAWLDEPFRQRNLGLASAPGATGDDS